MDDIWLYLARIDLGAADAWIDRMDARLRLLADNPRLGQRRAGYGPGLRSFTVPPYILFYQPLSDRIRLIRVLHGARDIAAIIDAD